MSRRTSRWPRLLGLRTPETRLRGDRRGHLPGPIAADGETLVFSDTLQLTDERQHNQDVARK